MFNVKDIILKKGERQCNLPNGHQRDLHIIFNIKDILFNIKDIRFNV